MNQPAPEKCKCGHLRSFHHFYCHGNDSVRSSCGCRSFDSAGASVPVPQTPDAKLCIRCGKDVDVSGDGYEVFQEGRVCFACGAKDFEAVETVPVVPLPVGPDNSWAAAKAPLSPTPVVQKRAEPISPEQEALKQWERDTGSPASLSEGNAFIDGWQAHAVSKESTPRPDLFALLLKICRNAYACHYQQNTFPGECDPCGRCANCMVDEVLGENWEKAAVTPSEDAPLQPVITVSRGAPPAASLPSWDAPISATHECYCKLGGMPHEICVCGKCGKASPRGTMRPAIDEHLEMVTEDPGQDVGLPTNQANARSEDAPATPQPICAKCGRTAVNVPAGLICNYPQSEGTRCDGLLIETAALDPKTHAIGAPAAYANKEEAVPPTCVICGMTRSNWRHCGPNTAGGHPDMHNFMPRLG